MSSFLSTCDLYFFVLEMRFPLLRVKYATPAVKVVTRLDLILPENNLFLFPRLCRIDGMRLPYRHHQRYLDTYVQMASKVELHKMG